MKNDNPNELTIENSVLVLIDHQPAVAINVRSIDLGLLVNNVAALAQAAKALGVPTVLTTVGAEGGVLVDPLFKEITEAFPDNAPIDRPSSHAWSHPDVRAAIDATGRKKLLAPSRSTGWPSPLSGPRTGRRQNELLSAPSIRSAPAPAPRCCLTGSWPKSKQGL
jgi:nicotinamidase-related amidase